MKNFGISLNFEYDIDIFLEKIDEFAENNNYGYFLEESNGKIFLNFEILPYLILNFKVSEQISMRTETCYYGAGYHCLVLDFIDEFFSFLDCGFEVKDDTGFYLDKDFEKLKLLFTDFMKEKADIILNCKEDIRVRSSLMSDKNLIPITTDDYICTYTGVVSFLDFEKIYKEGIDKLCDRFYLFNERNVDAYSNENYLLYHIWNNLKDLTLVDDFDERLSLAMFMFDNLIKNDVKIHLPQKFCREIYKYLGVNNFSSSNFLYRKVKYEVGYHFYDRLLSKLDFNLIIPNFFEYNSKINGYITKDNAIFLSEYDNFYNFEFDDKYLFKNSEYLKIFIFDTVNNNKFFKGYENIDDQYSYISIDKQSEIDCEETICQIFDKKNKKMYDISVLGLDSINIVKHIISLL